MEESVFSNASMMSLDLFGPIKKLCAWCHYSAFLLINQRACLSFYHLSLS